MLESTTGTAFGTYAKAVPCEASKNKIAELTNLLNINNSVAPHSLHTTVAYSRKVIPELESTVLPEPIAATPIGFAIFKSNMYNCLVILLESMGLNTLHQQAMSLGATYDYDQYHPHVTVSYDFQGTLPDDGILDAIGNLHFTEVIVEDLISD